MQYEVPKAGSGADAVAQWREPSLWKLVGCNPLMPGSVGTGAFVLESAGQNRVGRGGRGRARDGVSHG